MKFADVIQTADWKAEKHVPAITAPAAVKAGEKFVVEVSVGKEIAHPNTTEHHIRSIKLYFKPEAGKFAYEVGSFDFSAHLSCSSSNTFPRSLVNSPVLSRISLFFSSISRKSSG